MRNQIYVRGDIAVEIPVPENYSDCYKLAQSDYYRYTGHTASFFKMLSQKGKFKLNFWLRMASYQGWAHSFCNAMLNKISSDMNIKVSSKAIIGLGFSVSPGLMIEENAVIGSNVHLGPHVKISGETAIGDNTVIWTDSYVRNSIPGNVIASGNPAHVVRKRMSKDL